MAKNLEITVLYDFYGDMLTEKAAGGHRALLQRDSRLPEIAALSGITRQGVRDSIKRAEGQLTEFEERLGLAQRFTEIKGKLDEISKNIFEIEPQVNQRLCGSGEITQRAKAIAG